MKSQLIGLIKKPFVRNVITMSSGTAIAQVIALGSSPIITRLYGPEVFGVLGVFLAITGIIQAIGSLTYENAIVLPKKDEDAKAIVLLSFMISGIISFLIALIFIFFENQIVSLLQIEEVAPYVLLIPLFVFFGVWANILQQWLTRKEQFRKNAKIMVINTSMVQVTKIGAGLYSPTALILVYISTFGRMLHATLLSWGQFSWSKKGFENIKEANWFSISHIRKMAKKYYDFPLYRAPQSFVGNISSRLPILLLAGFFGPVVVGFYTLGTRVIKAPSNIIAKSFGNVFYPKIAKDFNNGEDIRKILLKATTALASVGLIPFAIIIIWGPELFGFIFGDDWLMAGAYARWMSILAYFSFMGGACWKTIPVIRMQRFALFYSVITTLLSAATLYKIATLFNDDLLTIASFCVLNTVLIIFKMFWVLKKAKS
jgi:O-antigen/teichoic acid export membrane protein